MLNRLTVLMIIFTSHLALGHGEDKLGPHGGFIRMPGAFHIEVLPIKPYKINIYLLDINWKNPSLEKSSIQVKLLSKGLATEAHCKPKEDHFECAFPRKTDLNKEGTLKILAQREGQTGKETEYPLPLKLDAAKPSPAAHESHH